VGLKDIASETRHGDRDIGRKTKLGAEGVEHKRCGYCSTFVYYCGSATGYNQVGAEFTVWVPGKITQITYEARGAKKCADDLRLRVKIHVIQAPCLRYAFVQPIVGKPRTRNYGETGNRQGALAVSVWASRRAHGVNRGGRAGRRRARAMNMDSCEFRLQIRDGDVTECDGICGRRKGKTKNSITVHDATDFRRH
jgi:hypothetical protein